MSGNFGSVETSSDVPCEQKQKSITKNTRVTRSTRHTMTALEKTKSTTKNTRVTRSTRHTMTALEKTKSITKNTRVTRSTRHTMAALEKTKVAQQCVEGFVDNTEICSYFRRDTSLKLCSVCGKRKYTKEDRIVACGVCKTVYHQFCHDPPIELDVKYSKCQSCAPKFRAARKFAQNRLIPTLIPKKMKRPYDLNKLIWNTSHTENKQRKYCYCGFNGEWYKKMLQCEVCLQWYHEICLKCLKHPLHLGDRFYIFVCAFCNGKDEFICRLELTWKDLVHLTIFNLIIYTDKIKHSLHDIVAYIRSNFDNLQLSRKILQTRAHEIDEIIKDILKNDRERFTNKTFKHKPEIWGIVKHLPPGRPNYSLPMTFTPMTVSAVVSYTHIEEINIIQQAPSDIDPGWIEAYPWKFDTPGPHLEPPAYTNKLHKTVPPKSKKSRGI